ncbi:hypothetical protein OK074_7475 [Actinobacteria bacterium OK074]|nr:hypothetical protein OK074_7475 [Actinobacteria bacterium OK074]
MKRTTLSLFAGTAALAAVTAFASASPPQATATASTARAATRQPVARSTLVCPEPSSSDLADTTYTSFTPVTEGAGSSGKAQLAAADGQSEDGSKTSKSGAPSVNPKEAGTPATDDVTGADTPALVGTATGSLAPGWTVQETTSVAAGAGRGLLGTDCTAPDTEFWFPGASLAGSRTDYVDLTNPDDSAAVVDIQLYGKNGVLDSTVSDGITVKPDTSEPILLSTLTDATETDVTVHVTVRSGRVGAVVQALDDNVGGDFLAASADPASTLVLPGIPADATDVRLIAFAPGSDDADLKLRLASPNGSITPAGNETLTVKSGMTAVADLGAVTRGEAGSLILSPSDGSVPVVAALQVVRGKGADRETAFIPATAPVGTRASVADNSAKDSSLALTAPGAAAKVRITASAGSEGGTAVSKEYTIAAGTTQNVTAPVPTGAKGTYALTVEQLSGGNVYGSRTLKATSDGVPAFTIQTLPDDRGMVEVPETQEDLSVLLK